MIVMSCQHETKHKYGKRNGRQRYICATCGQTFVDDAPRPLGNLRIDMKQATMALTLMLEGMSVRSTQRITGLCRQSLADLILVVGENCQRLLDAKIKNVAVDDVQVDELWAFVGLKEKKRLVRGYSEEYGDSWTYLGIERNTKLILAHKVGKRDHQTCWSFLLKLDNATAGQFQITTDGLSHYKINVPAVFGMRVHFAQLIKVYASTQEETRYSPARIISSEKLPMFGLPEDDRIST